MEKKKKKKKWYDTWWGLLYTLVIVDGNPGRGFHRFIEMDQAWGDLEREEDGSNRGSFHPIERKIPKPCLIPPLTGK
jgi:hypothetical protein